MHDLRTKTRPTLVVALAVALAATALAAGAMTTAAPRARAATNEATPQAQCGPGSKPEPDIQGRAPGDDPTRLQGYRCNLEEVSHFGTKGGYKVHRYVDKAGRECAYFDSTLLFPGSVFNAGDLTGIYVLDMANPAKPVKTANLLTPAMESPHESLELNQARGLLVADMGYPTFNPGFVDIYDVSQDCRNPVLRSSTPLGILGHESGFSPDGKTFYVSASGNLTALDISDPTVPKIIAVNREFRSHGVRLSADGNRLYDADLQDGLVIIDVSEIQARKPNPTMKLVSKLSWNDISIPQVAIPVTISGQPYVIEIDEFSKEGSSQVPSAAATATVGAARIIDISDETKPKVVSSIRLAVNNPDGRARSIGDPGASSSLQGYTGHYCAVPRNEEPGIVACSFVASGLRVFDIRDPLRPKEIAYFNKPAGTSINPTDRPSSYAMSASAFVPERGEIWYLDGNSGFYVLRFTNGVWPFAAAQQPAAAGAAPRSAPGGRAGGGTLPATGTTGAASAAGLCLAAAAVLLRRLARSRQP